MRSEDPRVIRLADYAPPDYLIDEVELDVSLAPEATRVVADLTLRPNPAGRAGAALALDGDELALAAPPRLDNAVLPEDAYAVTPSGLVLHKPPSRPFRLRIETELDPAANSRLMGLYRSRTTYCTQCEAEGFRRITYFLDRPDVLATYRVRIEADEAEAPVLLSNGNPVSSGRIEGTGRHFAVWHDPFPKPSYLFALVGGDLAAVRDRFVTASGREVALAIYLEHGKEERAAYAMDALKRAMRWDETAFGREYDLDVFNIVAVSDFNMGAMENKGLNVFNDKYVLASPQTATDADYAGIEAVIAHEYFHNWTGDRITCRDWFQLCLKEGLTVFRDQEFSSDQRSRPVKRIADVRGLRAHQFPEDAGPFAHPVRPDNYREINNFYTATVYEKGAEVVRMLRTLIGRDAFRHGMDLYFERHDGEAATVEDFVACFAEAAGRDLTQFMRWYSQAGTPELAVSESFESESGRYILDIVQSMPPTPGQPTKEPMVIPLAVGLIGPGGEERPLVLEGSANPRDGVLELTEPHHRFVFTGHDARPVPSLNRGFSAPVRVTGDLSDDDLLFLARHDRDPFARWQALQTVGTRLLVRAVGSVAEGREVAEEPRLAEALGAALTNPDLDAAFVAQLLALPSEADIAREIGADVDPDNIHAAREACRRALARRLQGPLLDAYGRLESTEPYSPDAASAGRRALRTAALDLLAAPADAEAVRRARAHYEAADNMTDRMAGLSVLSGIADPAREAALDDFYRRFSDDALVLDKWLALQAVIPEPETLDRVRRLTRHQAFSFANPNRIRSLIGTFAAVNPTQFNRVDGAGHAYVADVVLDIDARNPQVAARLLSAFRSWKTLEPVRRASAEAALRRIAAAPNLSRDVADLATRALA
jgi:aminopeptidase N